MDGRCLLVVACTASAAICFGRAQAQTSIVAQGPRAASESGAFASNQDQEDYVGSAQQIADDFTLTSPARLTAVTWEGHYSGAAIPAGKPYIIVTVRLYSNLASPPLLDASCEARFEQIGLGDGGSPIYRFSVNLLDCSHEGIVPYIEVGAQTWIALVEADRDTTAEFRWFAVADSLAGEFASRPNQFSPWQFHVGGNLVLDIGGLLPSVTYRLQDLGTLGGLSSSGTDLNEAGQAVGSSTTDDGVEHAFLWDGTTMRDLGTLGGESSAALALNASGLVTGYSGTADGTVHAFVWNGSSMLDLGTMGGSESVGYAINDSGWVTGQAAVGGDEANHAFLWNGTDMMDLGALDRTDSVGWAINASGEVAGTLSFSGDEDGSAAFIWNGDTMLDLTSDQAGGEGRAINNAGWVTGCTWDELFSPFIWKGASRRDFGGSGATCGGVINASGWVIGSSDLNAWVWNGLSIKELGTLGGETSEAADMNDYGFVTGSSTTAGDSHHAFIWDGTAMWDLNDLVEAGDPLRQFVTLHGGARVNNQGQILAGGSDSRTDNPHAYLVSVVVNGPGGDSDGDGIADSVDAVPGTSSEAFDDGNGTSGLITDRAGLAVTIADAASPEGVRVVVGAGSGMVTLDACGFTETVNAASELTITCGSVTLKVLQGAAQVVLDGRVTVVSIPAGSTASVADNGDGTFQVQNIGSVGVVTVSVEGSQTTIGPDESQSFTVVFQFTGFFSPVDNLPTLNAAKAGSSIPVKFGLGGNQGLAIFATGYPKSLKVNCVSSAPIDAIEETVAAGSSSLTYDSGADQYHYVWKTDKTWAGTCRQLSMTLGDSSSHVANFKFK